jgi:hypothetical protein
MILVPGVAFDRGCGRVSSIARQQMRCSDLRCRFVSRLGTARGTTIGTSSVIEVSQQAEERNRLYSVSYPHLYTCSLLN